MAALQNFLKKYSISKENRGKIKPTHTRIPDKRLGISGGSYHIPPEKENIFYTLYYNEIIGNDGVEYLTEKQKCNLSTNLYYVAMYLYYLINNKEM